MTENIPSPIINTASTHGLPHFKDDTVSSDDLAAINRIAPKPLRLDQVYVRSMYLCSTQPCAADHCRFSRNALQEIRDKIIGQSVLIGHNRNALPLARFFKAEVVQRDDPHRDESAEPVYFVRAWFYWLRDTTGAKDLLLNIDGGVYREVSLAWRFQHWRCSICGRENGGCAHQPGTVYQQQTCWRIIDHVSEVLEGSLVYKSADQDTVLSGARAAAEEAFSRPLVLVTDPDDPLLQYLEQNRLWVERLDLSDETGWLRDGIEQLWYRSAQPEPEAESWLPFLCEDGVMFVERYDETHPPERAFGTLQPRSHPNPFGE